MKKFLCKCLGGSHLYGLNTPASDQDLRGVYVTTDPIKIVGLSKDEFFENRRDGADEFYFELKHAISLLRRGNTQILEMLFNDRWTYFSELWADIKKNKNRLLDSEIIYSCLRGYMQGELRLALGERTGKLGGKRFEQLQRYGYSPKNIVQLFRLGWVGRCFFRDGVFPVHIATYDSGLASLLLSIKTEPDKYKIEDLKVIAADNERLLEEAYNARKVTYTFDLDYANSLLIQTYRRILNGEEVNG